MKITKLSEFTDFVGDLIRTATRFEASTEIFTVRITTDVVNVVKPYVNNGLSITLFDGEKKFIYKGITFTWG